MSRLFDHIGPEGVAALAAGDYGGARGGVSGYMDVIAGLLDMPLDHGLDGVFAADDQWDLVDILEAAGQRVPESVSVDAYRAVETLLRVVAARAALVGALAWRASMAPADDDTDCGGCANGEHCGYCPCCS